MGVGSCAYLKRLIGHSLGGSVAALIGVTFGVPTVAFEAPGEKLAASRLHLPTPVRLAEFSFWEYASDCHILSLLPSTSRTSSTQLTPSRWDSAMR
jgi:putative lipase involved disintegration of autophagic bodies